MTLEEIMESFPDEEFLVADGFDDAIIGVADAFDEPRLVYSVRKCIEILMSEDMSEEDALDHFYYNVSGAYVGPQTPIWCRDNLDII